MALFRKDGVTPLAGVELLLADLDGVVYRGPDAIPGAVECLNRAANETRLAYLTNNASRTDEQVAEHLRELGLRVAAQDIVTSPQAAVTVLAKHVQPGAKVLVVGGEGITVELEKAGYVVTRSADDEPDAVMQGFAPHVGWEHLAEAAFALAEVEGRPLIPWVATNTDWTIPVARGLAPGNGTLVSAVHTAVARLPEFAGKPEKPMYETAFARFGTQNALMIGDRLDTDTKGGRAAGIKTLHVLTGVDRPKQLLAASKDMQPDYIVGSLAELFEPYPETRVTRDGVHRVGGAKVRMQGHIVKIVAEGDSPLNLLRAACSAIYASGLAIYGLKVPEILVKDHWK
ncbi:HAD-IIA family hydrolase [Canibacter zhoujuaniae]|uniref:HAD-IIA family hydrolase n=1 Tax=Canibacter zhoujuaniae TaxID=2708343 RepID=UPI001424878E|nr:HAD-IIA family hydrolase [Canibacter zhoujuaniae]